MILLSMLMITFLITTILIIFSFWVPQTYPDQEKLSPYECGFDPLGTARLPFSLRFFLVAVLFLLFDLEIALLLPLPWAINQPLPLNTLTWATMILSLLTFGLIYEWLEGGLEWAE
uniref:NADH-ubiquinone oxidoreductase chain 3 n=1 Tax=Heloderma suspectum TaxID=8554 RepID=A1IGK2_HELSU|nr:NADH dehydrogenase subunit 3 [Heloderma suspectum]BAF44012.1 NADH dehydrogenase subunit 3 [Heloderma suspectum]